MPRPRSVDDDAVPAHHAQVFSEVGYQGASVTILARVTRLQKASLCHRFPGGKQQMAEEVLTRTGTRLTTHVPTPQARDAAPVALLAVVVRNLDDFVWRSPAGLPVERAIGTAPRKRAI